MHLQEEKDRQEQDQACEGEGQSEECLLEELENRCEQYLERLMRTQAELENYRKRTERHRRQMRGDVQAETVARFLPVIDNLERVLAVADDKDPVRDGVAMILEQVEGILQKIGVSRMATVGQPFDPHWHEAIGAVPTADYPEGTVAEEFLSGYRMEERLLRAAQVLVSRQVCCEKHEDHSVINDNREEE